MNRDEMRAAEYASIQAQFGNLLRRLDRLKENAVHYPQYERLHIREAYASIEQASIQLDYALLARRHRT